MLQEIIDKGNYGGIMPIRSWVKSIEVPENVEESVLQAQESM